MNGYFFFKTFTASLFWSSYENSCRDTTAMYWTPYYMMQGSKLYLAISYVLHHALFCNPHAILIIILIGLINLWANHMLLSNHCLDTIHMCTEFLITCVLLTCTPLDTHYHDLSLIVNILSMSICVNAFLPPTC